MTNPIAKSVGGSAKTLAQQIAKQLSQEPLEILKNAREQTTGEEFSGQPNGSSGQADQQKEIHEQKVVHDNMRSNRLIDALNRELDDIRKQKVFKELQEKIMNGEFVALEEYTELSLEQKQVLKAQMEAVKAQQANMVTQSVPLFGSSKPDRRMGQKNQAKKEETRVEKPIQNSG